ncbi:MFS transporter [Frigidibacter sp. RF13]|uniref:MFS transporter n=1 Tax=Frigidibacter sp. RF13 TaxID=2997340 RepID=UPI00226F66E8|nr:MFS transporter [Frigidibacter sp. RF13]MCY1127745.1 MFS transporter [Frigidibacter sp. RF13]
MTSAPLPQARISQPWTLVGFGFLALALAFSARAALGLIMPVWQRELGWSSSFLSGAGATALVVMALVAPFAGRLVDRKGPRFTLNLGLGILGLGCAIVATMSSKPFFVFGFSILCGLGFGIVATHAVATAVTRAFDSQRGLATGIATSGSTGGQFVIVPLIALLLTQVGWRWSFGALALASLALIPCIRAIMAEGSAREGGHGPAVGASMSQDFATILRRPAFHALFWSYLICGFTSSGAIETHLLPFAAFCGFPPLPSATAYGLLSLVNLGGMVLAGWMTDRVNRPLLLGSIYFLRGLTYIILINLPGTSIEVLFAFAVLFGLVDYATVPVTASLTASHVGLPVMGQAMGMISGGHALGAAMAAFFGGYVFDTTGGYTLLWLGGLWLLMGAAILSFVILRLKPAPQEAAISV